MALTKITNSAIADDIGLGGNPTTSTQTAGDSTTRIATTAFVSTAVANLVDSAPATLNTLNELAAAIGDNATFSSTMTTSIASKLPLAGGTLTGTLNLGDNVRARFGLDSDLQIYHDGSNSIISDEGTGELRLRGSSYVKIMDTNDEVGLQFRTNGAVTLYHNNIAKFETTSTGIDVTGTATMEGLIVNGNNDIQINRDGVSTAKIFWDRSGTTDAFLEVDSGENLTLAVDEAQLGSRLLLLRNNQTNVVSVSSSGINVTGNIGVTGTVDGIDIAARDAVLTSTTTTAGAALPKAGGTMTGALTGTTATFIKNATAGTNALNILGADNGNGTGITFSDNGTPAASASGQNGYFTYYHGDSQSYGSGNAFVLSSSETTTTILADGKLMYTEGLYIKPSSGTAGGTLLISSSGNLTNIGTISSGAITSLGRLSLDGALVIDTDTGSQPLCINRLSSTSTTDSQSLRIHTDDGSAVFESEQDETDRYGGYIFRSKNGTNVRNRYQIEHTTGDSIWYNSAGTARMFWDASAESLGIGTTSPSSFVESSRFVVGSGTSGTNEMMFLYSGTNTFGAIGFADGTSGSDRYKGIIGYHHTGDEMFFSTNGGGEADRDLTISSLGNVGIGTAAPIEKLDVSGYQGISVNANYAHMGSTVSGAMAIFGHNIKSDSGNNIIKSANNGYHSSMIKMYYNEGITFHATAGTQSAGADFYNISGTTNELMRLTNDGNVGIGTTAPNDGKLQVYGNSSSDWAGYFYNQNANGIGLHVETNSYGTEQLLRLSSLTSSGGSNTVRMVVRADGKVGIGTTSPTSKLEVIVTQSDTMTDDTAAFAIKGNGGDGILMGQRATTPYAAWIAAGYLPNIGTSHNYPLTLQPHGGNVGIGTTSPTMPLSVQAASNAYAISMHGRSDGYSELYGSSSDGSTKYAFLQTHSAQTKLYTLVNTPLLFGTNSTERMRIDSSGVLMIGTTDDAAGAGNSETGISLRGGADNRSFFSVNQNYVMHLNRKGNSGNILEFAQDGAGVGSIGVTTAELGIGGGDANLLFMPSDNAIAPSSTSSGGASDGVLDLGRSARRFKDLYLSSGVYLGGTGAANKLDDYEEGTWTPAIVGATSASGQQYTSRAGSYVKIGRSVTVNFSMVLSAKGSMAGSVKIIGLPFNGISGRAQTGSIMAGYVDLDDNQQLVGYQYAVNPLIYLFYQENDTGLVQLNGAGALNNNTEIQGSFTYFTDS